MTAPYALIDLAAIVANYRFLAATAKPARCGAAIKANAYGLGMLPVARALHASGCTLFFTAHFSEALDLRAHIATCEIVVLNGIDSEDFGLARTQAITPTLNHLGAIQDWATYAREQGTALPAMIHLDTGMNRLGLCSSEQEHLAAHHELLDGIEIKAWVSHLACADEIDNPMTPRQRDRLQTVLRGLPKAPVSLCNTSGLFWGADYLFDIARPGIGLYGGNPTPHLPNPMRAVMELRAPILQVHEAAPSETVGYGATHTIKRKGKIAVLATGYADGYHRALHNKGFVSIGGHLAPVIGRISMDLITVDVTDVPEAAAHVGAEATLIGPHRPVDTAASEAGTISYEILTSLGTRVKRVYRESC